MFKLCAYPMLQFQVPLTCESSALNLNNLISALFSVHSVLKGDWPLNISDLQFIPLIVLGAGGKVLSGG